MTKTEAKQIVSALRTVRKRDGWAPTIGWPLTDRQREAMRTLGMDDRRFP